MSEVDGFDPKSRVYFCWITANSVEYEQPIFMALIKKGYDVEPAASDKKLSLVYEHSNCALIAFMIKSDNAEKNASNILSDIQSIVHSEKIFHYSVIVSPFSTDAKWCGSNIIEEKVKIPTQKRSN